jgi:hypothetical protein
MRERLYLFVMGGAAVIVLLCLFMLMRIERRVVVMIDGYDLHQSAVTIGRGSDVCYSQIPEHFLTVTRDDRRFSWKVDSKWGKKDSLCYFKINGENPNLHLLDDNQVIEVSVGGKTHRLAVSEIETLLDGHESQYVMLRNVLERRRQANGSAAEADFLKHDELRSFFYRKKEGLLNTLGKWHLVILDNHTSLGSGGQTIRYATSGTVEGFCKVEFYRMAEFSLKSNNKQLFHIGDINYIAKPVLLSTEWGAGHVMLRPDDRGVAVFFPKPITYTEDEEVIRQITGSHTSLLTLQQNDGSIPVGQRVYIPQFSNSIPKEVCHLTVTDEVFSVESSALKSAPHLMPRFSAMAVKTDGGRVRLHTGIIGGWFIWSYFWLPAVMFLLIAGIYPWLVDVRWGNIRQKAIGALQLPDLFRMVVALAFAYSICRIMVAVKLSWTFPYFEKLTSVVVVDCGLMLLLLFTLSLHFNYAFLTAVNDRQHVRKVRWRKWVALLVAAAGWVLCLGALSYSDKYFSHDMLQAYPYDEVHGLHPLGWLRKSGFNELHRTIPYTLLMSNILTIVLLLVRNLVWEVECLSGRLFKKAPTRGESPANNKVAIGIAVVCMLLVAAATQLPGNFSSAPITLLIVAGTGMALCRVRFTDKKRWLSLLISFGIVTGLLLAAIAPLHADKGYFTNYLGMGAFAVLVFVIVSKYDRNPNRLDLSNDRSERKMLNWTLGGLMVAMLVAVPQIMTWAYDVEEVDYDRSSRRFEMNTQFADYRDSGYRYAVSDTEFLTVMVHGMFNASGSDPLSPERHALHPSVSTGFSPVVLNDVSLPLAFFGTYGILAYVVFFGLLVLLLLAVLGTTIPDDHLLRNTTVPIDRQMLWRMMAVMMWVGTSVYLYGSYLGTFPFTGKLCPGFGVDSVGEVLESMILLAFMTATRLRKPAAQQLFKKTN